MDGLRSSFLMPGEVLLFRWHGVITPFMPGMAFADAFNAKPAAFDCTVFFNCLVRVARAGGLEAAAATECRA